MNLESYKTLILNLPVRQQCFTTKRTTWQKAENEFFWLKQINNDLFGDQPTLTISRQEIFETESLRIRIIKTIYWGYTGGMRGNHFVNILKYIDLIENTLMSVSNTNNPTTDDFNKIKNIFSGVKGLGLSTYSKLLYFSKLTFNNNPCLILDQRLIDTFVSKTYHEFKSLSIINDYNKEKKYLDFLKLSNQLSKKLETAGENIEQFLFIFGNNLKT